MTKNVQVCKIYLTMIILNREVKKPSPMSNTYIFFFPINFSLKHERTKIFISSHFAHVNRTTTCDAREKFGPGERFLLVTGGALFAPPPEFDPFRFRRLFAGLCASAK